MDLIEQLGGYESAKAEYDDPMYEDGELYTIKATGARFFKHNLADELLQYRRTTNIFELGDSVLLKDGWTSVFVIKGIITDANFETTYLVSKRIQLTSNEIRHATNEEIKAGHRL